MASALKELQAQLENQAATLNKIQKDIGKNHQVRRQYTVQHGENEMVQKELELLDDDANVYKLIGPVLVKQDLAEAKANVNKRLDYITAELRRMDATLKTMEEQQNSKRDEVMKTQQRIQTAQAAQAAKAK
jgi:prefoldin beta subunit